MTPFATAGAKLHRLTGSVKLDEFDGRTALIAAAMDVSVTEGEIAGKSARYFFLFDGCWGSCADIPSHAKRVCPEQIGCLWDQTPVTLYLFSLVSHVSKVIQICLGITQASGGACQMTTPFCPPKPKEDDRARVIFALRLTFGTTSFGASSSLSWQFSVGGSVSVRMAWMQAILSIAPAVPSM